jgi:hypothetical protein
MNCMDTDWGPLTDKQVEAIAERAAEKAVSKLTNHVYQEVGRSVVQKSLYILGACAIGVYIWLKSHGYVK